MSEKEINIVIAEACGWTIKHKGLWVEALQTYACLPDYLNDLNAMHQAEGLLDDNQWLEYMLNLQDVLQRDPNRGKWIVCQDNMQATASQLAKAFVITIGKWKE